jgi:DNA-binding IclR family transcriptional regulator
MSSSSSTASKVLDILTLFNESRSELTAEDISKLVDSPLSSTYRYIRTLSNQGFLQKTAAGKYRLGPIFLQFEPLIHWETDIGKIALPVMQDIMRATHETVLLTRQFRRFSVCAERVEGPQSIRITFEKGHTQPLHAGASSKILLAYASQEEWERYLSRPLESFTENTITDPKTLKTHLREIRQQGYCLSRGEVDAGAVAIAVPIFADGAGGTEGAGGEAVVAGLSVAGPQFRMTESAIEHHLEALRAGAAAIQGKLD